LISAVNAQNITITGTGHHRRQWRKLVVGATVMAKGSAASWGRSCSGHGLIVLDHSRHSASAA